MAENSLEIFRENQIRLTLEDDILFAKSIVDKGGNFREMEECLEIFFFHMDLTFMIPKLLRSFSQVRCTRRKFSKCASIRKRDLIFTRLEYFYCHCKSAFLYWFLQNKPNIYSISVENKTIGLSQPKKCILDRCRIWELNMYNIIYILHIICLCERRLHYGLCQEFYYLIS